MTKLKPLGSYREEIGRCVKCGACRAHCPVFGAEKHEARVARGKIALAHALLQGDIDLEKRFLIEMSQCLLCGSCYAQCPNKLHTERIVAAARREIARRKGLSTFSKGLVEALDRPGLMELLTKSGAVVSKWLLKQVPEHSGLRLRLPIPYIDFERTLPELTSNPFRDRHPEVIPGQPGKPIVLLFSGCGLNHLHPQSGEALLEALRWMGVTVLLPKHQVCCGLPAVSAGAGTTVESLAEKNLAVFGRYRYDYIVTACASCHSGLTQLYPQLGSSFAFLNDTVKDVAAFLMELGMAEKLNRQPKSEQPVRVTYHDPCHLRHHGVTTHARGLLSALPQVNFVEMEAAGTCCGLGGTYSVAHYDTSKKIGAKKAAHIADSGAQLVATDCPGCIIQLQDSINHAGGQQRAVHLLDLVAEALRRDVDPMF